MSQETVLTGSDIAKVSFYDDQNGSPVVGFVTTDAGSEILWEATSKNIGNKLAVVLDGKIVSAPKIMQGIKKECVITGDFDDDDLLRFCKAIVLQRTDQTTSNLKTDKEQLQGTWVLQRGEMNGASMSDALERKEMGNLRVNFTGDLMTMSGIGAADHTFSFTLNPEAEPKTIDSLVEETPKSAPKGTRIPGIYKIDVQTLTLCLANDYDVERPTEFKATKGSRLSLLILVRDNP